MLYHIGPRGGCPLKGVGAIQSPPRGRRTSEPGHRIIKDKPAVAPSSLVQGTRAPNSGDRIVIDLQQRPIKPRKKKVRSTNPREKKVSSRRANRKTIPKSGGYTGPKGTTECPFCVLDDKGQCVGAPQTKYPDDREARRDGFEYVCRCSTVTDAHIRQFNSSSISADHLSGLEMHIQSRHAEQIPKGPNNDSITAGSDLSVVARNQMVLAAQHGGKWCLDFHGSKSNLRDLSHGQAVVWAKKHLPAQPAMAIAHASVECMWAHGDRSLLSATRHMEHRDAVRWWNRQLNIFVSMYNGSD